MDEKLGYAYAYQKGNKGKHSDYLFTMTTENISNFISKNAFTADKKILADICDRFIVESIYGGFTSVKLLGDIFILKKIY